MRIKILLYISLIVLSISCEDSITLTPENSATFANGMDTEQELYAGLTAAAGYVRSYATWNRLYPDARGFLADDVPTYWLNYQELGDDTGFTQGVVDSYKIINQAYLVEYGLGTANIDENLKNQYLGSVRFFQAWAYLEIMKKFGDCPIITDSNERGNVAKSTIPEVTSHAIELVQEAVELLPEYSRYLGDNPLDKAMPTKSAANALLAELCLWQAGCKWFAKPEYQNLIKQEELWQMAEDACSQIINSGEYALASSVEEVVTDVLVEGGSEGIFIIPWRGFDDEISDRRQFSISGIAVTTWPVREDEQPFNINYKAFRLTTNLVNTMYEANDERRTSYFYKIDDPEPGMLTQFAYPYKYRETRYQVFAGSGYKAFKHIDQEKLYYRLTQIYLMRAEARAQLNKSSEAIQDLNVIRQRANASDYNASEDAGDLLKTIYKECDREFVLEDERYTRTIRYGERFVREFFKGKFKTISVQDFTDGAFFMMYADGAFKDNQLFRQNIYWSRKQQ